MPEPHKMDLLSQQGIKSRDKTWDRIVRYVWARLKLSDLNLRRISAFLHRSFGPAIVQPPVTKIRENWYTWARVDIMQFLESWYPHIHGRVLDVGGGTWEYPRKVLSEQCDYLVLDCFEHPNVDVIGDIHRLTDSFEPDSFDFLVCCEVLEHVADPVCAVQQMHKILKPGGKLLLTVPFNFHIHCSARVPDLWRMTEQGLRQTLSIFGDVRIESTGAVKFPRSYLVVATK